MTLKQYEYGECYFCNQKLKEGIFETRDGMMRRFCSIYHIKRFFHINRTENEFMKVKIFISTEVNLKFVGMLSEFYEYKD